MAKDYYPNPPIKDNISHPKHYTDHPSGVECIEITEGFDFVIGNVIKYAWRAGKKDKNTKLEDLKKCKWYIDRAIKNETDRHNG